MGPKTQAELKLLAVEFIAGTIWTDRQCQGEQEMAMRFPVLAMMDPEAIRSQILPVIAPNYPDGPFGLFYEHLNEASPRSVNGGPMFFSLKMLTPDETETFVAEVKRLAGELEL